MVLPICTMLINHWIKVCSVTVRQFIPPNLSMQKYNWGWSSTPRQVVRSIGQKLNFRIAQKRELKSQNTTQMLHWYCLGIELLFPLKRSWFEKLFHGWPSTRTIVWRNWTIPGWGRKWLTCRVFWNSWYAQDIKKVNVTNHTHYCWKCAMREK